MPREHFEHEGTLWVEFSDGAIFQAMEGPMASPITCKVVAKTWRGRWFYQCEKCELNKKEYSSNKDFNTPQEAVENIDCECRAYIKEKNRKLKEDHNV